jgi:hypothetical protein
MLGVKMMVPFALQLPPRPSGASQRICIGPPLTDTLRSLPLEKNPRLRLSGDQKGKSASSVPSSASVRPVAISRIQSREPLGSPAMNASFLPSGEMAAGPATASVKSTPAGGLISAATGRCACRISLLSSRARTATAIAATQPATAAVASRRFSRRRVRTTAGTPAALLASVIHFSSNLRSWAV